MKILNLLNWNWYKKIKKVSLERPNLSPDEFGVALGVKKEEKAISDGLYRALIDYLPKVEGFGINPEDDLITDYDIDLEDIHTFIYELLAQLSIESSSTQKNNKFWDENPELSVKNIFTFVLFLFHEKNGNAPEG